MQKNLLLNNVRPYLTISISLIIIIVIIADSYIASELPSQWLTALWFSLLFSILAVIIQLVQTEKNTRALDSQINATKERLGNEIKHRLWAEKTASENKIKSQFIDENFPVMLAYFNTELRCRYHNRTFRRWFGLNPDQIDGRLLKEFSNAEFFSDIQDNIEKILTGKTIHNERILKSIKGFPYIFTEQYLPHIDSKGKTIGLYTLHTPRAQEKNPISSKNNKHASKTKSEVKQSTEASTNNDIKLQQNNQSSTSKSSVITAARIAQAIDGEEFNLYCQKIIPIKSPDASAPHYEILIRMHEEENNLMPPGSFLPLVDQFQMMPKLDRWIINHIVQWLSVHPKTDSVFHLNLARDTLKDLAFPSFIQDQLQKAKVTGSRLCFEIETSDAEDNIKDTRVFTQKIHELGCLISLCSFDDNPESVNLQSKIKVDYLKIDGSIICNILRDEEDLTKLTAINRLAQDANIKTIAELVETDDIIAKLQEIGVNYAQGFGIAKPHPFNDLEA